MNADVFQSTCLGGDGIFTPDGKRRGDKEPQSRTYALEK